MKELTQAKLALTLYIFAFVVSLTGGVFCIYLNFSNFTVFFLFFLVGLLIVYIPLSISEIYNWDESDETVNS